MILMNDFKAEPQALRDEMLAATQRVLASGWYVLGPECEAFETTWASTLSVRKAVGVGNGMDAIELILRALDIGPGDEVITTSMTAFATVLAVLRAGATPVLADIDPETALLDPASVARCLSPRTRALVLVHLYGQVRQVDRWQTLCQRAGIHLVEDCAQSHLAQVDGRHAGSFGIAGAYSFYPTKNLGAIGDGGAVVSNDEALAARVARLRNYGQSQRYYHPERGMNSRLDELQAALLSVRLSWLDGFTHQRRLTHDALRRGIANPHLQLLAPPQSASAHVHHLFVVRCAQRDALQEHLKRNGVQALIHYPVPVHKQTSCSDIACDPQGMQATEQHARECLSLPCHPQMSPSDIEQVVSAVNAFAPRD